MGEPQRIGEILPDTLAHLAARAATPNAIILLEQGPRVLLGQLAEDEQGAPHIRGLMGNADRG